MEGLVGFRQRCRCCAGLWRYRETWAGRLNLPSDRKIKTAATEQKGGGRCRGGAGREPVMLKKDCQVKTADVGECVSKGLNIPLSNTFCRRTSAREVSFFLFFCRWVRFHFATRSSISRFPGESQQNLHHFEESVFQSLNANSSGDGLNKAHSQYHLGNGLHVVSSR